MLIMNFEQWCFVSRSQCKDRLQTSAEQALVPYQSLVELSKKVNGTIQQHDTKLGRFLTASVDGMLQEFKASLSK